MRITERLRHPAPPEVVFAMLRDPRYQEQRCVRSGCLEHEVAIEEPTDERTDGPTVVTRRRMTTETFPDVAKRFVGSTVDIVETTTWGPPGADGSREAGYTLTVEHTPVGLVGGVHLAPDPGPGPSGSQVTGDKRPPQGAAHTVDGELSAHVPFLGRRIEEAVGPVVTSAIELESQLAREWLDAT